MMEMRLIGARLPAWSIGLWCVCVSSVCGQHWTQSFLGAQTVTELCSWVSLISFMALFIWLIIRTFQLVFSVETVFFSHNKSANSVFSRLISTAERAYIYGRTFQWSVTATSPVGGLGLPGPCGWGDGLGFFRGRSRWAAWGGEGWRAGEPTAWVGWACVAGLLGCRPMVPTWALRRSLHLVSAWWLFDSNSATMLTNNFLDKGIKLQPLHIAYQYVCCFYVLYIFNPYMV
jgi:hypothetical protein